jgi:hypothetical protein
MSDREKVCVEKLTEERDLYQDKAKYTYAKWIAAERKLERISDAWSDALYSDLENGVSSINDRVALEFSRRYPAISAFGGVLLDIMLEENSHE